MEKVQITIIGAGVIGLSIARELSLSNRNIIIIEKNFRFGQETSARNSEVIHSGIYYPQDSLKAKLCLEGKYLLYEFCKKYNIPNKNIGKLIVGTNDDEIKQLEQLFKQGRKNGVMDLEMLSQKQIKEIEPQITAKSAIYSPLSGIIDSHYFMNCLMTQAKDRGVDIIYNTEVKGVEKDKQEYKITVCNTQGEQYNFKTEILINCAGLGCDRIAEMVGINIEKENYKLKYCKGDYFRLKNKNMVKKLIYPVPETTHLGIHITPDMQGEIRLGPDATYTDKIEYSVDEGKREIFFESVKKFLPKVKRDDLYPDTAGIRPKLQGEKDTFRDFIILNEKEKGYPNFINLIGIDSPGLTCAMSIARYVKELILN